MNQSNEKRHPSNSDVVTDPSAVVKGRGRKNVNVARSAPNRNIQPYSRKPTIKKPTNSKKPVNNKKPVNVQSIMDDVKLSTGKWTVDIVKIPDTEEPMNGIKSVDVVQPANTAKQVGGRNSANSGRSVSGIKYENYQKRRRAPKPAHVKKTAANIKNKPPATESKVTTATDTTEPVNGIKSVDVVQPGNSATPLREKNSAISAKSVSGIKYENYQKRRRAPKPAHVKKTAVNVKNTPPATESKMTAATDTAEPVNGIKSVDVDVQPANTAKPVGARNSANSGGMVTAAMKKFFATGTS